MNQFSPVHQEVFELLTRQHGGQTNSSDHARLQAILRTDSDARQFYVDQVHLMALLCWTVGETEVPMVSHGDPAEAQELSLALSPRTRQPTTVIGHLAAGWTSLGGISRAIAFGIAGLLVVYFALLIFAVVWDQAKWADRIDERPHSFDGNLTTVAMVSESLDVTWSNKAAIRAKNAAVKQGEPLKIKSGTVELELNTGTKLVVEGPADWSVDGNNSVSLRSGKLLARVPEQAIGFIVETPTVKVVDLGTEFGIDVDATGRTDVQVITGKVAVSYEPSGKPEGSHQTLRMTAGAAKRFSSRAGGGSVTVTPIAPWLDKMAIGKNLSGAHQELPAEAKYAAAVLADRPIGYWRFSDKGDSKAVDASGHGNHGKYVGFVSTNNPGIAPNTSDQSIRFLGKAYAGYVQISDFELPVSFTVELWARSASPEWNTFGWLLASHAKPRMLFHTDKGSRNWRFLLMDADGTTYRTIHQHLPARIDDRLHQYVGAYDSVTDRGWMYFDGALVAEKVDVLGNDRRTTPFKTTIDVGRDVVGGIDRYGEGWIDEVAFYDRVLSADSVLNHYRAATNISKAVKEESDSKK